MFFWATTTKTTTTINLLTDPHCSTHAHAHAYAHNNHNTNNQLTHTAAPMPTNTNNNHKHHSAARPPPPRLSGPPGRARGGGGHPGDAGWVCILMSIYTHMTTTMGIVVDGLMDVFVCVCRVGDVWAYRIKAGTPRPTKTPFRTRRLTPPPIHYHPSKTHQRTRGSAAGAAVGPDLLHGLGGRRQDRAPGM